MAEDVFNHPITGVSKCYRALNAKVMQNGIEANIRVGDVFGVEDYEWPIQSIAMVGYAKSKKYVCTHSSCIFRVIVTILLQQGCNNWL
jgi:hypothetical protein